ncbi:MAG: PD-(D/E)XK nuclease family protein [Acidimicrobiales bacterium]
MNDAPKDSDALEALPWGDNRREGYAGSASDAYTASSSPDQGRTDAVSDVRRALEEIILQPGLRGGHEVLPTGDDPAGKRVISNSQIKTYKRCQEEYRFKYVLGREEKGRPHPFAFGSVLDAGLGELWQSGSLEDALKVAEEVYETEKPILNDWDFVKIEVLIRGYEVYYREDGFETLAVQHAFWVDKGDYVLHGIQDAIRLSRDKERVGWELKSTGLDFFPGSDYEVLLQLDSQVGIYFEGAEQAGFGYDTLVYDIVGKRMPDPLLATPVENRRYRKGDGELYAKQRLEDENIDQYRERALDVVLKNPRWFYRRIDIVRLEAERQELREDVEMTVQDMLRVVPDKKRPRTDGSCKRYKRLCPYAGVCMKQESLYDNDIFQKRTRREARPATADGEVSA